MSDNPQSLYKITVDWEALARRVRRLTGKRYKPRYLYGVYNGFIYSKTLQKRLLDIVAREPLPQHVEIPPCAQ